MRIGVAGVTVAWAGTATGASNDLGESGIPAVDPDADGGPDEAPDEAPDDGPADAPDARVARRRPIDDKLRLLGRTSIVWLCEVVNPVEWALNR